VITARNEAVTYTGNNLITRGTGGTAISYRFDARGNCTNAGTASAPRFFEYDPDNNLLAAHVGPTNWFFRYNAQNQMAWSQLKVNGTVADERCYLYDGLDCIAEVTPSGTILREFIRNGTIGGIVAETIHNDPTVPSEYRNSTLYYHYNHRGDVVAVSDSSGKHVWQSDYDAFGQPMPVKSEFAAFDPRYTFSTKRYFAELGTYYYGYRWYLPEICRWMQKDPIAHVLPTVNYYRFCAGTPTTMSDSYGLLSLGDLVSPIIGRGGWWRSPWQTEKDIEDRVNEYNKDLAVRCGEIYPVQINDFKYGHANAVSEMQKEFGMLGSPFIPLVGIGYEVYAFFAGGHAADQAASGLFDGQHPVNWAYDTPGDIVANTVGQITGLVDSLSLGMLPSETMNKITLAIPGPDYSRSQNPQKDWKTLASPSVANPFTR